MRYPPGTLDEIRARLPVSEVVGKRVRLQKAGREWKGLSPFNAEKTPSFFVNDQKGFYHDFSSGKHGDIFSFLMETEGVPFPEAVERLAAMAGVDLPKISPQAIEQEERSRSLVEVMAMAASFFQAELRGRAGTRARAYLDGRGLSPETRDAFGIGYAPADRFSLRDHLAGKGVTPEAMMEVGLLVQPEGTAVPFDRFRDRVMFPICDVRGRVIAFGGRALEKDVPAKYLNSPETTLFHKGRVLYNHHNARKAAHDKGSVIAVEGYVDVIAMSAVGFANTVAPLGTALTPDQLALLWRMADEPILCFDGDKAGRRAAYRALDVALPIVTPGKSLRIAFMPEGQDPDDLARAGGHGALARVIDAAQPLAEVLWAREVEAGPLDTPERRAALERRLRDLLSAIQDEDLRRHYRADMDARLRAMMPGSAPRGERRPWVERRGGGRFEPRRPTGIPEQLRASPLLARSALFSRAPSPSPRESLIVLGLAAHADLLADMAEALASMDLADADAGRVRQALVDAAAHGELPASGSVRELLEAWGLATPVARLEGAVRPGDRWCLDSAADPEEVKDSVRQAMILHRRALTLHNELGLAQTAFAQDDSEANLAWIRDLQAQISAIDGTEAERERPEAWGEVGSDGE
ncbi:DNA primase [uncultured Alsobacter sp.]|uniref:DNA primase n=1 Tax=uncultured Alsobacter sp. TaxID=1748258 RepID=UPI0025EDAFD8|nr:DNA primase [uncultured Alsobacter sp.]